MMLPASGALFALASNSPATSWVYAIVGYDDAMRYPYVVRMGAALRVPMIWNSTLTEKAGELITYPSYDSAIEAKRKAGREVTEQGRTLVREIETAMGIKPRTAVSLDDPWATR